jgi:uncharacterized protein YbjT (DUF2867 family)
MILVIGATGFIGQQLVAQLAQAQYPICCLVRPSRRPRYFAPGTTVQIVTGDLDDAPALRLAMHKVTTVFYLATTWEDTAQETVEEINVRHAGQLVDAMQEAGVRRLITLSSIGADSHSAFAYLRGKGLTDEVFTRSDLDYTILESSAVYGAGDGWTESIALALRRWPFFFPIPGDGRVRLQPIWVQDLVSCCLACLADPKSARKTFVVGGSQALTYDDFISLLMQVTGRRRAKRYMRPASALSWSRFLRGLLSGHTLYTPTELDLLSVDRTTALDSVSYQFGFTPARPASSMDYLK